MSCLFENLLYVIIFILEFMGKDGMLEALFVGFFDDIRSFHFRSKLRRDANLF